MTTDEETNEIIRTALWQGRPTPTADEPHVVTITICDAPTTEPKTIAWKSWRATMNSPTDS